MTEKSDARVLAEKVAKQAKARKEQAMWNKIKFELTLIAQKYNREHPI